MLNYQDAKSELALHFKTFWETSIASGIAGEFGGLTFSKPRSIVPYTPKIQWEKVEPISAYDTAEHWLRFNTQDILTSQDSFAGSNSEGRKANYQTFGLITVQLFFSKTSFDTVLANRMKRICQKAFQGTRTVNGIWFKNPTVIDLAEDTVFFRSNVAAEYVYNSRN